MIPTKSEVVVFGYLFDNWKPGGKFKFVFKNHNHVHFNVKDLETYATSCLMIKTERTLVYFSLNKHTMWVN